MKNYQTQEKLQITFEKTTFAHFYTVKRVNINVFFLPEWCKQNKKTSKVNQLCFIKNQGFLGKSKKKFMTKLMIFTC